MTPEERAEALVRTRSVPDGTYEGRERVLFVGDVRLDGEGGPFPRPEQAGARGLIAALRHEVARVIREAEADLIPAAIKDEQPVDETRLEQLRDPNRWDVPAWAAGGARELLSLLDYYRRLVTALASESGWQHGYDAGRRDGYRDGVRACATLAEVKRATVEANWSAAGSRWLRELEREIHGLLGEGDG